MLAALDCQPRLPGANSANQLCAFEGHRANHLAHNHGALTMTDRLVHGGGAERRNTKDEHAMLLDYRAVMPLAAVGPAKFSLRFAHWLWTHLRQAVVISTVRCQLRVPSPTPRLLAAKRVCIDGAKAWSSQMYRGEPT